MSTRHRLLLVIVLIGFVSLLIQFYYPYPVGWDVFYHLHVSELIKEQGLLPWDLNSTGGRLHTYLPGYHILLLSFSLLSNLRLELASRIISPVFFALSTLSIFNLTKKYGDMPALFATLLFATSTEVLSTFVSAGMPQAAGYFLILVLLSGSSLSPFFALSMSMVHGLSAVVYVAYLWLMKLKEFPLGAISIILSYIIYTTTYNPLYSAVFLLPLLKKKKTLLLSLSSVAFIFFWHSLTSSTYLMPSWGRNIGTFEIISRIGVPLFSFSLFSLSNIPPLYPAASFYLLTQSCPYICMLPTRFVYHLIPVLLLLIAHKLGTSGLRIEKIFRKKKTGLMFVLVLLSYFLLTDALNYGAGIKPAVSEENVDALRWADKNLGSSILAYKDYSASWVLYYTNLRTILDGFSEGVPDAYERMEDQYALYSAEKLDLSFFRKWNVNYQYITDDEKEWYKDVFNYGKFKGLILYDSGEGQIIYYDI